MTYAMTDEVCDTVENTVVELLLEVARSNSGVKSATMVSPFVGLDETMITGCPEAFFEMSSLHVQSHFQA